MQRPSDSDVYVTLTVAEVRRLMANIAHVRMRQQDCAESDMAIESNIRLLRQTEEKLEEAILHPEVPHTIVTPPFELGHAL
jgi:hypothetical protein